MLRPIMHASWESIWQRNPALVQLLGLCPLLAVSTDVVSALGLGMATLLVVFSSNVIVASCRSMIARDSRIIAYVLIIAGLVTIAEIAMSAFSPLLHERLGIFLPLIVTNCVILGRAEAFASRNGTALAALDGLASGLGFLLVLLALGGMRELVGQGSLCVGCDEFVGLPIEWTLTGAPAESGFLLALLPPGAFFSLALLVVVHRWLSR